MRSIFKTLFFSICLVLAALSAAGQAAPRASEVTQVELGQSMAPLNGPWKFHVGDDARWARPEFDDSSWETVDLKPKEGSFDPNAGFSGYVPGWTALGHAGHWGYAWYRIHIRVKATAGQELAIAGPANVDDAYQVYANGVLLGSFGTFRDVPGSRPIIYNSQPRMFSLAAEPAAGHAGETDEVLAFRLWMDPNTLTLDPSAGGLHSPPLLGEASVVTARYQLSWVDAVRTYFSPAITAALFLLMAIVAGCLILFDDSDPVYLWLSGVFLLIALATGNLCLAAWTQLESYATMNLIIVIFLRPLTLGGWVMVWWVWFRLRRPVWFPRALTGFTVLYMLSEALGEEIFFAYVPHPVSVIFHTASLIVRLIFLLLLVLVVSWGIRQQGREGWLALPAVVLVGIAQFQIELQFLHVRTLWFPFGVQLTLAAIAYVALLVAISILLLRRLLLSMRRQREVALDIKQAQEVQQVLIPEDLPKVAGLVIQSEYRPARLVGGDFFQILPNPQDGSLLIVVGDVTGKGLQAGMLVALIVGAIRNQVESSFDPLAMLESLNRRLYGRGSAHATCQALLIAGDGSAMLANAGHLAPYLNGKELPMEGALPLGMIPEAEFSVMPFQLVEGDRLFLMSDGVAEAQDLRGELFGFERIESMLRAGATAEELATAAQSFGHDDLETRRDDSGQSDDILVLGVIRDTKNSVKAKVT